MLMLYEMRRQRGLNQSLSIGGSAVAVNQRRTSHGTKKESDGDSTVRPGTGSRPIAGTTRCREQKTGCPSSMKRASGSVARTTSRLRRQHSAELSWPMLLESAEAPLAADQWLVANVCSEYIQYCQRGVANGAISKSHLERHGFLLERPLQVLRGDARRRVEERAHHDLAAEPRKLEIIGDSS